MKKFLSILALTLSLTANAGTVHSSNENNGIVTPDVAIGVARYHYWTNDLLGNMLVCIEQAADFDYTKWRCDQKNMPSGNNKGWTPVLNVIPASRKYVGFRIVSQGSSRSLEVYWK
jgi:hypothetical protein